MIGILLGIVGGIVSSFMAIIVLLVVFQFVSEYFAIIFLGIYYLVMIIVLIHNIRNCGLFPLKYFKLSDLKNRNTMFALFALLGIFTMFNREAVSPLITKAEDAISIMVAPVRMTVENNCDTESISRVYVHYEGDKYWTLLNNPRYNPHRYKLHKKRISKDGFSLKIVTKTKKDSKLPEQKYEVFYEKEFIRPNGVRDIALVYDGERITINNDKVTSDGKEVDTPLKKKCDKDEEHYYWSTIFDYNHEKFFKKLRL